MGTAPRRVGVTTIKAQPVRGHVNWYKASRRPGGRRTYATSRELDILRLVAAGNANKQIARQLAVADGTIKAHLKSIFAKLDVADRTHAVTVAAKRGMIEL